VVAVASVAVIGISKVPRNLAMIWD
jgi:hypothetical protein